MQVVVLGPMALVDDGRRVAVTGEKARTVLALLALTPGEPVSAGVLIDELWRDDAPAELSRVLATALEGVAGCLPDADATRSAMLLGAAETVRGAPVPGAGADRVYVDAVIARGRAAIGDGPFEGGLEAGRACSNEDAIELALRDGGEPSGDEAPR